MKKSRGTDVLDHSKYAIVFAAMGVSFLIHFTSCSIIEFVDNLHSCVELNLTKFIRATE